MSKRRAIMTQTIWLLSLLVVPPLIAKLALSNRTLELLIVVLLVAAVLDVAFVCFKIYRHRHSN